MNGLYWHCVFGVCLFSVYCTPRFYGGVLEFEMYECNFTNFAVFSALFVDPWYTFSYKFNYFKPNSLYRINSKTIDIEITGLHRSAQKCWLMCKSYHFIRIFSFTHFTTELYLLYIVVSDILVYCSWRCSTSFSSLKNRTLIFPYIYLLKRTERGWASSKMPAYLIQTFQIHF